MSGMAEVLASHSNLQWSFEYGGFVCVECGWQETYARPHAKDAEACARSSHLASVLTAAGFGDVREAKAQALEEAADTVRNKDHRRDLHPEDRHAVGWSHALNEVENKLRQRAAAVRGEA